MSRFWYLSALAVCALLTIAIVITTIRACGAL